MDTAALIFNWVCCGLAATLLAATLTRSSHTRLGRPAARWIAIAAVAGTGWAYSMCTTHARLGQGGCCGAHMSCDRRRGRRRRGIADARAGRRTTTVINACLGGTTFTSTGETRTGGSAMWPWRGTWECVHTRS